MGRGEGGGSDLIYGQWVKPRSTSGRLGSRKISVKSTIDSKNHGTTCLYPRHGATGYLYEAEYRINTTMKCINLKSICSSACSLCFLDCTSESRSE